MQATTYQFSTPYLRNLGYLTWFVLLVFAVIFYQERTIFMDGAFQLEEIINQKSFKIYHYRLTNPLTQILAVIGIYLKLPLKWVLIGYSVNFILFFAGIYHLIVHYFKNDFLGWVQLFFFTLLVLDSFYFLTPEFYQGMSLLCLWFAILLRFPSFDRPWVLPLLAFLLIPILFDHKLIAAFFLYFWVFFWLNNRPLRQAKYYGLLIWMFVVVGIHSAFFTDWYDGMKQATFVRNFETYFPNFHKLPANMDFLQKAGQLYYFYPITLFIILAFYGSFLSKDQSKIEKWVIFLKITLIALANLGYLLLIHIGDPVSPYRFYAEVNYIGLSVLVSLPLLFDVLPKQKKPKLIFGLFLIVVSIRLVTIANNHQRFEDRHQWFLNQMNSTEGNRFLLSEKETPMDVVIQSWPSPQESLLLTALEHPDSAKTLLIYQREEQFSEHLEDENCFLTSYKKIPVQKMNPTYFKLKSGKYRLGTCKE